MGKIGYCGADGADAGAHGGGGAGGDERGTSAKTSWPRQPLR